MNPTFEGLTSFLKFVNLQFIRKKTSEFFAMPRKRNSVLMLLLLGFFLRILCSGYMERNTRKGGSKVFFSRCPNFFCRFKQGFYCIANVYSQISGDASCATLGADKGRNILHIGIKPFSLKMDGGFFKLHCGVAFRTWFLLFHFLPLFLI